MDASMLVRRNQAKSIYEYTKSRHILLGKGLKKKRATQASPAYNTPLPMETQEGIAYTSVSPPVFTVQVSSIYGSQQITVVWTIPNANSSYVVSLYAKGSFAGQGSLVESIVVVDGNSYTFAAERGGGLLYYATVGITYLVSEGCYQSVTQTSTAIPIPFTAPSVTLTYVQGIGSPLIQWSMLPYATYYSVTFYRVSLKTLGLSAEASSPYIVYASPTTIPQDFLLDSYYYYATVQAVNSSTGIKGLLGTSGLSVQYYEPVYVTNVTLQYAAQTSQIIVTWSSSSSPSSSSPYTITFYTNTVCSTTGGTILCTATVSSQPFTIPYTLQQGMYYYATVQPTNGVLEMSMILTANERSFVTPLYESMAYYPDKYISTRILIDSTGNIYTGPQSNGEYFELTDDMTATLLSGIDYIAEKAPGSETIFITDYTQTEPPIVSLTYTVEGLVVEWSSVPHATSYTLSVFMTPRVTHPGFAIRKQLGYTTSPAVIHLSLSPSMYYYVQVTPVNGGSGTPGTSILASANGLSFAVQDSARKDEYVFIDTKQWIMYLTTRNSRVYTRLSPAVARSIGCMIDYIAQLVGDPKQSIMLPDYTEATGPSITSTPTSITVSWLLMDPRVITYTVILYSNTAPSLRGGNVIADVAVAQTPFTYVGTVEPSLYYYASVIPFYLDSTGTSETPGSMVFTEIHTLEGNAFTIPYYKDTDAPENIDTLVVRGTQTNLTEDQNVDAYIVPQAISYATKRTILAITESVSDSTENIYIDTYACPPAPVVSLKAASSTELVISWTSSYTDVGYYTLSVYSTTFPGTTGGTLIITGIASSPTVIQQALEPGLFYYATVLVHPATPGARSILGTSDILCANEIQFTTSVYETQASFTQESIIVDASGNVYISASQGGIYTQLSASIITSMLNSALYITGLAHNTNQPILLSNYTEYPAPTLSYSTKTYQLIVEWVPIESALSYTCNLLIYTGPSSSLILDTVFNVTTPMTLAYSLTTGFEYSITITPIFANGPGDAIESNRITSTEKYVPSIIPWSVESSGNSETLVMDSHGHVSVLLEDGTFYELPSAILNTVLQTAWYITGKADDPKESILSKEYTTPLPTTLQYSYAASTFVVGWELVAQATSYTVMLYSSTTVSSTGGTLLSTIENTTSPCTFYQPLTPGMYYYAIIEANPSRNTYTTSLFPGSFSSTGSQETPILIDVNGNVYVSIPSLGVFYELSDDAVATVINGIDYISGLAVDPSHSISVDDYRPTAAPTITLTYALQTNEFVVAWPTVLNVTSYTISLYSSSTYSTTGGTLLSIVTASSSPITLQYTMVKDVFYYATVSTQPVNSWAPQYSPIVTLDSIRYTVPVNASMTEEVVIIGSTVYVSTDVPGTYYKLTDSMTSTVLNDIYCITKQSTAYVDINVKDYTSTIQPSITFSPAYIKVEWTCAYSASSYDVYLYSSPSADKRNATLLAVQKSTTPFILFPYTPSPTLFYFASVLAIESVGLQSCCLLDDEPRALETTAFGSPVGQQITIPIYNQPTDSACCASTSEQAKTATILFNTHLYIAEPDGIYQFTDSMLYTILNGANYIASLSPATVHDIYLSDYSILQSAPTVSLSYTEASTQFIVSWTPLPNATSYVVYLYATNAITGGTPHVINISSGVTTSPLTITRTLSPTSYYYATVKPFSGTLAGVIGTSQFIAESSSQWIVPVSSSSSCDTHETQGTVTVNGPLVTVLEDTILSTLSDSMASSIMNGILYITSLAAQGSNIYLTDYASQAPPPVSLEYAVATNTCVVTWPPIEGATSYTVTLYSNTTASSSTGQVVAEVQGIARSPTTIPLILTNDLYYYATLQAFIGSTQQMYPIVGTTDLFTPGGVTYSIPLVNGCDVQRETIVVDENGVFYATMANGSYTHMSEEMVQSILQTVNYVSDFSTDSGKNIYLNEYSYVTVPRVALSYSLQNFTIQWNYVPTATSYTVTLYKSTVPSMVGASIIFTQTLAMSVTSFASTPEYGYYYVASVLPTFPNLQGMEGVSNYLFQSTTLIRI